MNKFQKHIDQWTAENAPLGKELGYPECCIKEFCENPPVVLKYRKVTKDDESKIKAAYINGKWSGFIPCAKHAKEINAGKITLASLITNRNPEFKPFPNV